MLSVSATSILQNPERYKSNLVLPPNAKNQGIISVQLHPAPNVHPSDFLHEATLLGNLQDSMLNLANTVESITTSFIGSELGYIIVADDNPKVRIDRDYDPRLRAWYISTKARNKQIFTDFYIDAFGKGLIITCAQPFYRADGSIAGVVGVDMYLSTLKSFVKKAKVGDIGFAFILNKDGEIIISEDDEAQFFTDICNYTEIFADLLARLAPAESDVKKITIHDRQFIIAFTPINIAIDPTTSDDFDSSMTSYPLPPLVENWYFASIIEVDEAFASAILNTSNIITLTNDTLRSITITITVVLFLLILCFFGIMLFTNKLAKKLSLDIVSPIISLQDSVKMIANGSLEHRIDLQTGDEIESLGLSVNKMAQEISDYIKNLQYVTTEKERFSTELSVAHNIQESMLPSVFPSFSDYKEFDLYAYISPAKEIGGDFYDFFFINEDVIATVIADVSGKGIPAALFMVITKTLIKSNAQRGMSPHEVLETVNNLLCENNNEGMFVTIFLAYINIKTGKVLYVNAGHNPPLIYTASDPDATPCFAWLKNEPNFVMAGFGNITFEQYEINLSPGDILFLYTDGITEALNSQNELFTSEKLLETANHYHNLHINIFCDAIKYELEKHTAGAEQTDDIAMMAIQYKGEKR